MYIRRFIITAITIIAILQWAIVLERLYSAIWLWYKFVGYGGGGHITVGWTTQLIFITGSITIGITGFIVFKAESSEFWKKIARIGWLSVTVCILMWIVFIISPLVKILL